MTLQGGTPGKRNVGWCEGPMGEKEKSDIVKYVAWFMVALVVVALAGVGYLYATAQVVVEALGAHAYEAQSQQATFDDLKRRLENGTVLGMVYQNQPLGDSSEYAFVTYTVRLRNDSLISADMVEVQIVPTDKDILQMGDTALRSLPPRSRGDITGTILTKRDSDSMREIIVTYYIWGKSFSIKETYSR